MIQVVFSVEKPDPGLRDQDGSIKQAQTLSVSGQISPVQLGRLFSKRDAYGIGMIMPLSMGGINMKMGMGIALMRVKQRLLFVYLYAEYKNEDTVKWLRKTTDDWADAILKANN